MSVWGALLEVLPTSGLVGLSPLDTLAGVETISGFSVFAGVESVTGIGVVVSTGVPILGNESIRVETAEASAL